MNFELHGPAVTRGRMYFVNLDQETLPLSKTTILPLQDLWCHVLPYVPSESSTASSDYFKLKSTPAAPRFCSDKSVRLALPQEPVALTS